ncbi:hypothetical protein [Mycolicibacterium lutetiense]|uniref:DNA-directed RNA polymerase subunit RPC12/RpoP n=1 Tax=Mycolicibacterium lutetiense TaxID=1641992 RepID=A0ABS4ZPE9_9MYCO|nr:hypothetical protein [Mycolicibacterium lutetiense]MBP2450519.1 DNA-directed RNA polymerase subunit RPC12/RpoP [Mycolicibacterium lutetiense]
MNDDSFNPIVFFGPVVFGVLVIVSVWLIPAIVAGLIADRRGRSGIGFALATFFFLGPLGVGVALLATRGELDGAPWSAARRKLAQGRRRYLCDRCGAINDIAVETVATDAECWRCGEHWNVEPAKTI